MIKDANQVPRESLLQGDLCIIGGGVAGITIAREFMETPAKVKVLLLESGGLEFQEKTQSLYEGKSVGLDYDLSGSRRRYFGGSSNTWWGNCRPLDAIDFQKRDWIPFSGWPFDKNHLRPYYERAAKIIRLGQYEDFEWKGAEKDSPYPALPVASNQIVTRVLHESGALRFRETYGSEIKSAGNVEAYLHANVTEIVPDERGKQIRYLKVATLDGNSFTVAANH